MHRKCLENETSHSAAEWPIFLPDRSTTWAWLKPSLRGYNKYICIYIDNII